MAALPPADLLPVSPRANLPYRLVRFGAVPLAHVLFRFDVSGRENVPRRGPYIVIANHLGWVDWVSLLLHFPIEPRVHFLGDPEGLVKRPVEWYLVRATGGYVPVDRSHHGDSALYRHVDRCLELGGAIAIFPEGNYGPAEGGLLPLHKGFAHFAVKSGAPVVPVGLAGTREVWLGKRIEMRIGEPIEPAGETPESLTAKAEERLRALLPAYADPGGRQLLRNWLTHLF
ncbi:MAG TPA: 1-acyl-sn-glycerol-3-phosphate acyltransferase [Candidatus Dormibacteraeota bacterium]